MKLFNFFKRVGRAVAKSLKNLGLPVEFKNTHVHIENFLDGGKGYEKIDVHTRKLIS